MRNRVREILDELLVTYEGSQGYVARCALTEARKRIEALTAEPLTCAICGDDMGVEGDLCARCFAASQCLDHNGARAKLLALYLTRKEH